MLNLSAEPRTADEQMRAIIFYLTVFGHIDGEFDLSEQTFVRQYIEQLVTHRVAQRQGQSDDVRRAQIEKYTRHFHEVFEAISREVAELFAEAVAHDEAQDDFHTLFGKAFLSAYEQQLERLEREKSAA